MPSLVEVTQSDESKKFRWIQCLGGCCICGSPLKAPGRTKTRDKDTTKEIDESSSGESGEEDFEDTVEEYADEIARDRNLATTWFFSQIRDPVSTLYTGQGIDITVQEGHLIEASILFAGERSKKTPDQQAKHFTSSIEKAGEFLLKFEYKKDECLRHYTSMVKDADNYTIMICKECNTTMTSSSIRFITLTHNIYFLEKSWLNPQRKISNKRPNLNSLNDNIISIMTFFYLKPDNDAAPLPVEEDFEQPLAAFSINHFDIDDISRHIKALPTEQEDDYLKHPPDLYSLENDTDSTVPVSVQLIPTPPRTVWKRFAASRTMAHMMAWAEKKTWRQRLVSIFWAAVYIYHTLEYDEMVTLESWYVSVFRPFYDLTYEQNSWFGYLSESAYSSLLPHSHNHGTTKNRQSRQWIFDFLDACAKRMKPFNEYFFLGDENSPKNRDESEDNHLSLSNERMQYICTKNELNRGIDKLFARCSNLSDIYSFYHSELGTPGVNALAAWCLTNCSTDRRFTGQVKNALKKIIVLYKLNNRLK